MGVEAYLLAGCGRGIVPGLLTLVWAVMGCGGSEESLGLPPPTSGTPDELFPDADATSIVFRPAGQLGMVAGQTQELTVEVTPPGEHTVRFALLGDTDGAFLSRSVVVTLPDGTGSTSLTALAAASNFSVRAATSQVSTTLEVVTLEASQASLVVTPNYDGRRPVEAWVASVHPNTTCAALEGVPFPDGQLDATGTENVRITGIPAEVPMAVVVRAGQFAGGCRGVPSLRASSETAIIVDVMDRPLQTAALELQVELGVAPAAAPNPALDELAFRAVSPLTGGANDDLTALVDAMSSLAVEPLAFEQARVAQGWRAALVGGLAPDLPGNGLRTLVQNWMRSGLDLLEAPDALQGTLTSLGADGSASLALRSVIGLPPAEAGFQRENTATAVAETEDFLRIGTTLEWRPSPFLAAAANWAALDRDPERTSAADAMATQFGCSDVADILVGVGSVPGEAFADCDTACVEALCRDAMGVLWSRVGGSELPAVPWQITAASRAEVDAEARPAEVEGDWIGTLTVPDFETTPIGGPFSGESSD
jgi:hypothetical protein